MKKEVLNMEYENLTISNERIETIRENIVNKSKEMIKHKNEINELLIYIDRLSGEISDPLLTKAITKTVLNIMDEITTNNIINIELNNLQEQLLIEKLYQQRKNLKNND